MSAILVYYEHEGELSEVREILKTFKQMPCYTVTPSAFSFANVNKYITGFEAHILICLKKPDKSTLNTLANLNAQWPFISIIYLSSVLNPAEFSALHKAGINHCYTGKSRFINLKLIIRKINEHSWKKVPETLVKTVSVKPDKRAKAILLFIENNPINKFKTDILSEFLELSESHFRKEFKKIFKTNFRTFKQNLLAHYEAVLLFEKKLKPGHIYQILDYKNMSAFSRSFKMRHGSSWRELKIN
jgi:AraC-like DNA-binding protein